MSVVPSAVLQFFRDLWVQGLHEEWSGGIFGIPAACVVDEFRRMDIPVRASEAMKDLGVKSTAGRRRCAWKVRLRRRTAFRRAR
eukprot:1852123-Pyramimonas_sp.AAC.1